MVTVIKVTGVRKVTNNLGKVIKNLPKVSKKVRIQICNNIRKEMKNTLEKKRDKRWHNVRGLGKSFHVSHKGKGETAIYSSFAGVRVWSADKGTRPFTVTKFNPFGHTWKPQQKKSPRIRGNPPYEHVANRRLNYVQPSVKKGFNKWKKSLKKEFSYKFNKRRLRRMNSQEFRDKFGYFPSEEDKKKHGVVDKESALSGLDDKSKKRVKDMIEDLKDDGKRNYSNRKKKTR